MIQYLTKNGVRRRVHREYVDVMVRWGRGGDIEPVSVGWRDGRRFTVSEVLERGELGVPVGGVRQARWRVRFGGKDTVLYLERRMADEDAGEPERNRWWVYAYDE